MTAHSGETMPFTQRNKQVVRDARDQLFISRYASIFKWALHLAKYDVQHAQDLVQDAYVHFTLPTSDPNEIRDVDAYIYSILKHLNASSMKTFLRYPMDPLSVIDYDYSLMSLHAAADRNEDVADVQNNLRIVCRYFCFRKQETKSASLILLRFVHSYSAEQLVNISGLTWNAIRQHLYVARTEVKAHLRSVKAGASPREVHILSQKDTPDPVISSSEMVEDLRAIVFDACCGECPEWAEIFESSTAISTETLSHLVSCKACLNKNNTHHEFRPSQQEGESRNNASNVRDIDSSLDALSSRALAESMEACSAHLRQIYEHFPNELRVAVNGQWVVCQDVTSEVSRLHVSLPESDPVRFIEIFSEQDVRMALFYIEVEPPDGPAVLQQEIPLSSKRLLRLLLSFSSRGLLVDVEYHERIESTALAEKAQLFAPRIGKLQSLLQRIKWVASKWQFVIPAATAVVAALCLVVLLAIGHLSYSTKGRSARATLLAAQGAESDQAYVTGVLHRLVGIQSVSSNGIATDIGQIDVWSNAQGRSTVRRLLLDDGGVLDDINSSGPSKAHKPSSLLAKDLMSLGALVPGKTLLDLNASATDFSADGNGTWHTLEENTSTYRLNIHPSPKTGGSLVEATLTLDRHNLHVIQEDLVVQSGGALKRFRLKLKTLRYVSEGSIPAGVFPVAGHSQEDPRRAFANRPQPSIAAPAIKVHALYLLSDIGADMHGEIEFSETAHGAVVATIAAGSSERRKEIANALAPAVGYRLRVKFPREEKARLERKPTAENILSSALNKIPVDAQLRRALATEHGSPEGLDVVMHSFANKLLDHSSSAKQHAWAIVALTRLLSPNELRNLPSQEKMEWLRMLAEHSDALADELQQIDAQVHRVFPASESTPANRSIYSSPQYLRETAETLLTAVSAQSEAIDESFALSPGDQNAGGSIDAMFWRRLQNAEDAARNISRTTNLLLQPE